MSDLALLAYHYHYRYGGGWADWITHMVVSSAIHAIVYNLVFRIMHQLTLGEGVVLVVIVLGCLFMWDGHAIGAGGSDHALHPRRPDRNRTP